MISDDTIREELNRLARQGVGSPAPDSDGIVRRAHRIQRRRAAAGVAAVACLVVVVVGAGLSLGRTGAAPAPAPGSSIKPGPSSTAPPAAVGVRVTWVRSEQVAGHPPSQTLFVDAGRGAQRVTSVENAALIPGGFLDDGRTVVWASGNGEPAPYAQALSADGKPEGSPRQLIGGRLIGSQAILSIPTGGIAMRVLPKSTSSEYHLLRMVAAEVIASDVAIPEGEFTLLTADATGVVAAFPQPNGAVEVRHISWDGTVGALITTIDACASGEAPAIVAPEDETGPRQLGLSVAPCDPTTAAGRAGGYVLVAALDATNGSTPAAPMRLIGWTGLVDSLWWDEAGTLHVHAFTRIDANQDVADPRSYAWAGTGDTLTPDGLDELLFRLSPAGGGQVLEVTLASTAPQPVYDLLVQASVRLSGGATRAVFTGIAGQFVVR